MNDPKKLAYWNTSKSAPSTWIERAADQITKHGGIVLGHGFGMDHGSGRQAFMLAFTMQGDRFQVVWPVLDVEDRYQLSARRQAATMLFHDVKAKCLASTVKGARSAFFEYLLLPDGRTAAQLGSPELGEMPSIFATPQLRDGL